MHPFLTFASGLLLGVAGVRLLKTVKAPEGLKTAASSLGDKARHGLDQAQAGLRDATVSGLSAIERSSASLRDRLVTAPVEPPVTETSVAEAPVAKPRKAKAEGAAAKPARKRAAKASESETVPEAAPEGGDAS